MVTPVDVPAVLAAPKRIGLHAHRSGKVGRSTAPEGEDSP
jgi:hypothetical protein